MSDYVASLGASYESVSWISGTGRGAVLHHGLTLCLIGDDGGWERVHSCVLNPAPRPLS